MKTRNKKNAKSKSFKNKIHQYICKKQDICCEKDYKRDSIINEIFDLYMKIAEFSGEKDEYLSYIDNDLVKFIGYYVDLKEANDVEGMHLWNRFDSYINPNKKLDKAKIISLFHEVPLYYILSFLGSAYYRYKEDEKIENMYKK